MLYSTAQSTVKKKIVKCRGSAIASQAVEPLHSSWA